MQRGRRKHKEVSASVEQYRQQLRSIRLVFLPPEKDVFHLFASLGIGLDFLSIPFTHETARDIARYLISWPEEHSEIINRLGDWYLGSSSVGVDYPGDGNGFFWELLQQSLVLYNKLQDLDETTELFHQFYTSCTRSMQALLQFSSRFLKEPLRVSVFHPDCGIHHRDVVYGCAFLLTLAKTLPELDVQYTVLRMVFCSEPFINLEQSDPKTKSIILSTGFQLIDILIKRQMDIQEAVSCLQDVFQLIKEEFHTIQQCLRSPLSPQGKVGFLPESLLTSMDRMKYLEMTKEADSTLLELGLVHIQRLICLGLDPSQQTIAQNFTLWFEMATGFLQVDFTASVELKIASLDVLVVGVQVIRKMNLESPMKIQLIKYLEDSILPCLESYLHLHVPNRIGRIPTNDPPPRKELKVLDVVIRLIGIIHGLMMIHGVQDWNTVVEYGLKPFSVHTFSEKASSLHRNFLSLYLASVLEVTLPHPELTSQIDIGFCLYFWFRQILEIKPNAVGFYLSLVLSQKLHLGEETGLLMELAGDTQGSATRRLIQRVMESILHEEKDPSKALFMVSKLHDFFKTREKELEEEQLMQYLRKVSAVIGMLLKITYLPRWGFTSQALYQEPVPLITRPIQGSILHLYFTWIFKSILYLQHHSQDPRSKKISEKETPLVCLGEIMDYFISEFNLEESHGDSSWLKAFQLMAGVFLEAPNTIQGPSPVDLKVIKMLVAALDPDQENSAARVDLHQQLSFIQFFLKTSFWFYVEKAANGSLSADRCVVNGLYLLKFLFSCPSLRNSVILCRLLPCLFSPLTRILKSDCTRDLSPACQLVVFQVLLKILEVDSELLPDPPLQCNHLEITGSVQLRGGILETGQAGGMVEVKKGIRVLLILCFRSILSNLRFLLPESLLSGVDSYQMVSTCFRPITKLDAARAQASFTVLFGQYQKPSWTEKLLLKNQEIDLQQNSRTDLRDVQNAAQAKLPEAGLEFLRKFVGVSEGAGRWVAPILHPLHQLFLTGCPLITPLINQFVQIEELVKISGVHLVKDEESSLKQESF